VIFVDISFVWFTRIQ